VANTWQMAQVIDVDDGNGDDNRNEENRINQPDMFVANEIPVKLIKFSFSQKLLTQLSDSVSIQMSCMLDVANGKISRHQRLTLPAGKRVKVKPTCT